MIDDRFYALEAETEPLDDALHRRSRASLAPALERLIAPLLAARRSTCASSSTTRPPSSRPTSAARIEAAARGLERRAQTDRCPRGSPCWTRWRRRAAARIRRLVRDRARRRPRPRCRASAALDRSHHSVGAARCCARRMARSSPRPRCAMRQRDADDWQSAEVRTGAAHLPEPPKRASFGSPFRYAEQARIFIVSDVNRRDVEQLAAAVSRTVSGERAAARSASSPRCAACARSSSASLRRSPKRASLSTRSMSTGSTPARWSISFARRKTPACSAPMRCATASMCRAARLRLVVFDKVPWPKPTILHKARRARFGKTYDDLLTRLRLKQAFGRLIRSQERQRLLRDSGTGHALAPAFRLSPGRARAPLRSCGSDRRNP